MSRHGSRFDEAAHRCPVPVQLTGVGLCGVGMGVEVDETERSVAMDTCQARPVAVGDGVVASEHDRNGTGGCNAFHRIGKRLETEFEIAGSDLDVPGVHNRELLERVDAGREMRPVHVGAEIVGLSNSLRPEASAPAVGGAPVDRRSEDDDVRLDSREIVQSGPLGHRRSSGSWQIGRRLTSQHLDRCGHDRADGVGRSRCSPDPTRTVLRNLEGGRIGGFPIGPVVAS